MAEMSIYHVLLLHKAIYGELRFTSELTGASCALGFSLFFEPPVFFALACAVAHVAVLLPATADIHTHKTDPDIRRPDLADKHKNQFWGITEMAQVPVK